MQVIYEDDDALIIDKPAGVSVHPRRGDTTEQTVVDLVRDKVKDDDPERPGIVHRLDKDTSGVMIIAKNPQAKRFLQSEFKNREVKKTYIALVHGRPKHDRAVLNWPIGRNHKNPLKRAVVGNGREAISEYKLIKQLNGYSLLEVYPKTGRMHQIRVHLAHLGHPVVGDKLYGKPDPKLNRQFLHAQQLTIKLPSGETKTFTSPLPKDLEAYLNALA